MLMFLIATEEELVMTTRFYFEKFIFWIVKYIKSYEKIEEYYYAKHFNSHYATGLKETQNYNTEHRTGHRKLRAGVRQGQSRGWVQERLLLCDSRPLLPHQHQEWAHWEHGGAKSGLG